HRFGLWIAFDRTLVLDNEVVVGSVDAALAAADPRPLQSMITRRIGSEPASEEVGGGRRRRRESGG
ncbi:hypothetical protein ACW9HQ_51855, partial [Nocardia gipuzkoensis]